MLKIISLFLLFTSINISFCDTCIKYDFEKNFDVLFSNNSLTCQHFSSWQTETYSESLIGRPNAGSTKFLSPVKVVSTNEGQLLNNCIKSFGFPMEAGGIVEVMFYIKAKSQRDLLYVTASKIVPGANDVEVGFAKYSRKNLNYKDGWNILKIDIGGSEAQFDGYVNFYATVTEDAIIMVDSFLYIGPHGEKENCDLELITEYAPVVNNNSDVEIGEPRCVTYDFETGFDTLFNNETDFCSGSSLWELQAYENFNIASPHVQSSSFITPANIVSDDSWQIFGSCVASFVFTIAETGSLEVTLYMEAKSSVDILYVDVTQITSGGSHISIGHEIYSMSHPDYSPGWNVLKINVQGISGEVNGYVSFLGTVGEESVLLVDSFRYISSTVNEEDCVIYTDAEVSTTTSDTPITTDELTTVNPTTDEPTTVNPTTYEPTTVNPTTNEPTTVNPTTKEPTTVNPATDEPTTVDPTTDEPTTINLTTDEPTTINPTTDEPTTINPTTDEPTTVNPTTYEPTTVNPTTNEPTTVNPTTKEPTTVNPATDEPTTVDPTTDEPTTINLTTDEPTTINPTTDEPTTINPTTDEPTTVNPTTYEPTTVNPTTNEPTTVNPTTKEPTTVNPATDEPTTIDPTTDEPTTINPTTDEPTTVNPTTYEPTTVNPTTNEPTTVNPTTKEPTTVNPATDEPTTIDPTTDEPTTVDSTTIKPTTSSPVEEEKCVLYDFENDFDLKFSNASSFCNGFPSWELDSYTNINIVRPHVQSNYFITPTIVISENVWQTFSSCITSFPFSMEAGGIIEVKFYMEGKVQSDNLLVAASRTTPDGYDDIIINLASYSPIDPDYEDGWNTLRVEITDVEEFEGHVLFLGTISENAVLIVDSFRYIGPTVDENNCIVYTDPETTTSISTTDNPTTTASPPTEEDLCVTYDFEDNFDSLFTHENDLCVGFSTWHLGNYTSIEINGADPNSDLFMTPDKYLSCIASFPFAMSSGGIVEINVFMEPVSNFDYITVLAKMIVPNGVDTVTGMNMYNPSSAAFVRGWNVLQIPIASLTNFNGYILFLGAATDGATVLVDSFRYIPPTVSGDGDQESCAIY